MPASSRGSDYDIFKGRMNLKTPSPLGRKRQKSLSQNEEKSHPQNGAAGSSNDVIAEKVIYNKTELQPTSGYDLFRKLSVSSNDSKKSYATPPKAPRKDRYDGFGPPLPDRNSARKLSLDDSHHEFPLDNHQLFRSPRKFSFEIENQKRRSRNFIFKEPPSVPNPTDLKRSDVSGALSSQKNGNPIPKLPPTDLAKQYMMGKLLEKEKKPPSLGIPNESNEMEESSKPRPPDIKIHNQNCQKLSTNDRMDLLMADLDKSMIELKPKGQLSMLSPRLNQNYSSTSSLPTAAQSTHELSQRPSFCKQISAPTISPSLIAITPSTVSGTKNVSNMRPTLLKQNSQPILSPSLTSASSKVVNELNDKSLFQGQSTVPISPHSPKSNAVSSTPETQNDLNNSSLFPEPNRKTRLSPPFTPVNPTINNTPPLDLSLKLQSRSPLTGSGKAKTSKGNCKECGEKIYGKSVFSADGRLTGRYHKECFVCKTCQQPFQTTTFYILDDRPYCEIHYHELNGSICSACRRGIEGQYIKTERGQIYHPDCLICVDCKCILRNDYFEIDNLIYCKHDAYKKTQKNRSHSDLGGNNRLERRVTKLLVI